MQIAQGIPSAAPHIMVSKVFASSSDEQAIVVDLNAASFNKMQHQMRPFHLMGFYEGVLEQIHQIPGNERRMGHANLAELATGLFKEKMKLKDIRYYKQSTAFGEVEIMYPGNKSGSIDTTNVNNATENCVFDYIQKRVVQDVGTLLSSYKKKGEYRYIGMTANFLGDDYKSQVIYLNKIPDDEKMMMNRS